MENTLWLFLFAGWSCLCLSSQLQLFLLWSRDDKMLLWHIHLWGICRVKHLVELFVLPEPEQNPWWKEQSLGLGHKNQRPYQKSNGILFSAFLNESLKVCMPGFNLSKEIKSTAILTQIQQAYSNQLTSLSSTLIYKVNCDPLLHIFQNLVFWWCIKSGARESGRANTINNA